MPRSRFSLAFVLALAACSDTGTSVLLTVDADPPLTVATLQLAATAGGTHKTYTATPPGGTIPPAVSILLEVPPSVTGQMDLTVTALDSDGATLVEAVGAVELQPGAVVRLPLTLGASSPDLGDDLATPPDLYSGLYFDPMSGDFGRVNEGMASASTVFTIQNLGAPTGLMSASVSGPNASEFTIDATTCKLALPTTGTCTVTVSFHPGGSQARTASLVVGDGSRMGSAPLSGYGVGLNGRACGADTDCVNGHCVDGFCCNVAATSCSGCKACNVAGSEGTCSAVANGSDPHNACTTGCYQGCNGAGACAPVAAGTDPHNACTTGCYQGCNGAGACAPVAAGTDPHNACTGVCTNKCDGAGACAPAASNKSCGTMACANSGSSGDIQFTSSASGALVCGGATTCGGNPPCAGNLACDPASGQCKTACVNDQDCMVGSYCNGGICSSYTTQGFGGSCASAVECAYNSNTGAKHMFCLNGKCQNCVTSADCLVGFVCKPTTTAPIGNACFYCGSSADCSGSGWGNTCAGSSSTYCTCSGNADCTNDRAPYCLSTGNGLTLCGCVSPEQRCGDYQICVGPASNPRCLLRPGITCTSGSECASNACVNGRCQ